MGTCGSMRPHSVIFINKKFHGYNYSYIKIFTGGEIIWHQNKLFQLQ